MWQDFLVSTAEKLSIVTEFMKTEYVFTYNFIYLLKWV